MAGSATGFVHSSAQGKAAELKAAVLLMERGHEVAVPLSDNGVDLVVDYCWRVQVKSSFPKVRETNSRAPGYAYLMRMWSKIRPPAADFFVLHSFEDGADRWWIVPSHEFGFTEKSCVTAYEGSRRGFASRLNEFESRWDLFPSPPGNTIFSGMVSETRDLVLFDG